MQVKIKDKWFFLWLMSKAHKGAYLAVWVAAHNDMLDAIDDTAQLQSGRLGGDLFMATQVGMRHQVSGITDWGKV